MRLVWTNTNRYRTIAISQRGDMMIQYWDMHKQTQGDTKDMQSQSRYNNERYEMQECKIIRKHKETYPGSTSQGVRPAILH